MDSFRTPHDDLSQDDHGTPPPNGLLITGLVFSALGLIAMIWPTAATVAFEQFLAWMLLFWGGAGLGFAWSVRPAPEWRYAGALFGLLFALGLVLLLFPVAGVATLTMLMLLILLLEGVFSVMLGLRFSRTMHTWGWMVFSGLSSLAIGLIVLFGWPDTAVWLLGVLIGLNFLTTGMALVMLSRAGRF